MHPAFKLPKHQITSTILTFTFLQEPNTPRSNWHIKYYFLLIYTLYNFVFYCIVNLHKTIKEVAMRTVIVFLVFLFSTPAAFGQGNNGALSITPREQVVMLTTLSKMPHLIAIWDIRGMFEYDYVVLSSISVQVTGPSCAPHEAFEVRTSTRGVEKVWLRQVARNVTIIIFGRPLVVSRVQEIELGIYSTSNPNCSYAFAIEAIAAEATTPKGGIAETSIGEGFGGVITPSN